MVSNAGYGLKKGKDQEREESFPELKRRVVGEGKRIPGELRSLTEESYLVKG